MRDGENSVALAFINLHLSCWNIEKSKEPMSADVSNDAKEKDDKNEDIQKGDKCRLEEPVVAELTESHESGLYIC